MRLSVYTTDRGYAADAYRYEVLLDGIPLRDCVTADEEQGTATVHMRDSDGKLMAECGRAREKTMFGEVRIRRVA